MGAIAMQIALATQISFCQATSTQPSSTREPQALKTISIADANLKLSELQHDSNLKFEVIQPPWFADVQVHDKDGKVVLKDGEEVRVRTMTKPARRIGTATFDTRFRNGQLVIRDVVDTERWSYTINAVCAIDNVLTPKTLTATYLAKPEPPNRVDVRIADGMVTVECSNGEEASFAQPANAFSYMALLRLAPLLQRGEAIYEFPNVIDPVGIANASFPHVAMMTKQLPIMQMRVYVVRQSAEIDGKVVPLTLVSNIKLNDHGVIVQVDDPEGEGAPYLKPLSPVTPK